MHGGGFIRRCHVERSFADSTVAASGTANWCGAETPPLVGLPAFPWLLCPPGLFTLMSQTSLYKALIAPRSPPPSAFRPAPDTPTVSPPPSAMSRSRAHSRAPACPTATPSTHHQCWLPGPLSQQMMTKLFDSAAEPVQIPFHTYYPPPLTHSRLLPLSFPHLSRKNLLSHCAGPRDLHTSLGAFASQSAFR